MAAAWTDRLRQLLSGKTAKPLTPAPEWYRSYGQLNQPPPNPQLPLEQINFIVLDVESTGLKPKQDRLLSIGALRVQHNQIQLEGALELYLDPPAAREKTEAIAIHGLLPGTENRNYVEEEDALRQLLAFVGSGVLVGHHLGFDLAILNAALQRLRTPKLRNKVIDTAKLAKKLQPPGYLSHPQQFQLDQLARQYKIPLSDRHTALGDCYITAILLMKLLHQLRERKGRNLLLEDLY
ncbi:MAG: 3'-5' exonuclease [Bacteroidota bacterium]